MIEKMPQALFENTETAFAYKTSAQLVKAKFLFHLFGNKSLVSFGSSFTGLAMSLHLPISPLFKYSVYNHFCGGETFDECKKIINLLKSYHVGSMLNYGVELKETEEDFEKTIDHTLEAIAFAGNNRSVKCICIKLTGFGRFGLFEKISADEPLMEHETGELEEVKGRFDKLCKAAAEREVVLYVDAEESWIQAALDELVDEMMAKYNTRQAIIFNTFQLYRTDRFDFLKASFDKAEKGNYQLGAKIVRGAYMEKERKRAQELNYPSPIHKNKHETDLDFNAAMTFCFEHLERVAVCVASQSEESNLLAISLIDQLHIPHNHPHILFSQLYGMGDNITFNLAKEGFNACKYLPYGPVKDVIPYLIRRAEENTSVHGQMGRELKLIVKELNRRKA